MSERETGTQVWSIGIDLGTTHCALSYRRPGGTAFELLPVPQFVEEGQYASSELLPSFGLQPEDHQRAALTNGLPWTYHGGLVVGQWARRQAYRQPGRVITSAKSWLSNMMWTVTRIFCGQQMKG